MIAATILAVVAGEVAGAVGAGAVFGAGVAGMFAACVVGVDGRVNGKGSFEKMLRSKTLGGLEVLMYTLVQRTSKLTASSPWFCCFEAT